MATPTWTTRKVYESTQPVDCVAVSATDPAEVAFVGSALAGDTWDGTVGVLRLDAEGEDAHRVPPAPLPCGASAVAWLGADIVVLACDDGTVPLVRLGRRDGSREWDGGIESLAEDAVHDDMAVALAVAPAEGEKEEGEGSTSWRVASGGADGVVRVWATAGTEGTESLRLCAAFAQTAKCHGVAWTADGTLAAAYSDGALRLYDVRARACVAHTRASRVALTAIAAAGSTGSQLAVGDDSGAVCVLDSRMLGERALWEDASAHGWACRALTLHHTEGEEGGRTLLASGGEDCRVVVRCIEGGEDGNAVLCCDRTHIDAVTTLAWCNDKSGALLSGSRDRTILNHTP